MNDRCCSNSCDFTLSLLPISAGAHYVRKIISHLIHGDIDYTLENVYASGTILKSFDCAGCVIFQ